MKRLFMMLTAVLCVSASAQGIKVLMTPADADNAALRTLIRDNSGGAIDAVDYQDGRNVLLDPALAIANGYKVLLLWANYNWASGPAAFGDRVAQYIELGGAVVYAVFADQSGIHLQGNFGTKYSVVNPNGNAYNSGTLGTVHQPGHPIMQGVSSVTCSNYKTAATALRSATYGLRIADWSTGEIEAAAFDSSDHRVAFLGWFPGQHALLGGQWLQQLINSITWAGIQPVPNDVSVTAITSPPASCDLGTYTPAAKVKNAGTSAQSSFQVMYRATGPGSYLQYATCPPLAPGEEVTVNFPPWTISTKGSYAVSCSTMLASDERQSNDKATMTVQAGFVKVLIAHADLQSYAWGLAESLMKYFPADLKVDTMCIGTNASPYRVFDPVWAINQGYKAVLTFANYGYYNSTWQGDSFARYMELGGGGVIWAPFGTSYNMGRYSSVYAPITTGGSSGSGTLGTVHQPGHDIMAGVSSISMGAYTESQTVLAPHPTAYRVADWSSGSRILVACNDVDSRRAAVLGFFPTSMYYTTAGGDWLRMLRNAFLWAAGKHDVAATKIEVPVALVDSNTVVTPACSVFNYGNFTESYDVRMKIGAVYNQTAPVANHAPGTYAYVEFPTWDIQGPLGNLAVTCSTELATDGDPSNDKKSGTTFVRKLDVGVLSLTSPSGMYTPGQSVNPEATWRNHGNTTVDFEAWVILNDPTDAEQYREKVDLSGIAPGGNIQVSSFPGYTVNTPGIWTVRCSTGLAGDVNPDNDVLDDEFIVGSPDMRALAIVAPVGQVETSAVVVPSATVKNEGTVNLPFRVWFIMNSPGDAEEYREYLDIAGIAPGGEQTYPFPEKNVGTTEGQWTTRCSVYVASDQNTANDFIDGNFTVAVPPPWESGWHEAASVPVLPSNKPLKDGAWLAVGPDKTDEGEVIYAAKGNKATDFYKYNPAEGENGTWYDLNAIPEMEDGKRKPPSKGTRGVAGDGAVYMTRGNNMLGFYKYDVEQDTWLREEDVPLGDYKKKVKGGNDMVYVVRNDTGYVYLLKGQKTEFYRFNTATAKWEARDEVPYQTKQKYDKGSFLVFDGDKTIYAHQAKVNNGASHYMFAFDLETQAWSNTPKKGIPVYAKEGDKTKKKKVADGAAGAWSGNNLYAIKGGNTQSFFKYTVAQDTWVELDNMPALGSTMKNKRIKAGGHLAAYGGAFFAFKGNKTYEFWRYVEPTTPMMATRPGRDGVAAGVIGNGEWRMGIGPNPLSSGFATLRYSLPNAGPATVTVFDIAGRSVVHQTVMAHRTGAVSLDLRKLSAGVYLVRLDADSFTQTQKLVVQR